MSDFDRLSGLRNQRDVAEKHARRATDPIDRARWQAIADQFAKRADALGEAPAADPDGA